MTSAEQYATMVHERFGGYRPIWYPNTKISVGDILILKDDDTFERYGSLSTYGPTKDLKVNVAQGACVPIDFVSSEGVTVSTKLSGETNVNLPNVPVAKAGISFQFERKGDFSMYADSAAESYLADVISLEQEIKKLVQQSKWDSRFVIAAKVLATTTFTLLLGQTANSSIELSIDGVVTPSIPELGKVGVTVSLASSRGSYVKIIGAKDLTPLVEGVRLSWTPWGGDRFTEV